MTLILALDYMPFSEQRNETEQSGPVGKGYALALKNYRMIRQVLATEFGKPKLGLSIHPLMFV